jgi:uncharacterized protein (DUF433 family)
MNGHTGTDTMTTLSVEHITKTPGVCGGKACIAGHRIRVMDVVAHHEHAGRSPAEILEHFPGVTLGDVYAALAYYHDHRAEIEADFANEREWAEFGKTQPSKLKAKLEADPGLRDRILSR